MEFADVFYTLVELLFAINELAGLELFVFSPSLSIVNLTATHVYYFLSMTSSITYVSTASNDPGPIG